MIRVPQLTPFYEGKKERKNNRHALIKKYYDFCEHSCLAVLIIVIKVKIYGKRPRLGTLPVWAQFGTRVV